MKLPDKYLRKSLIDALPEYKTFDVGVPNDEPLPDEYIIVSSITRREDDLAKGCFEWDLSVQVDIYSYNIKGFFSSAIVEDMEAYVLDKSKEVVIDGFVNKDCRLVQSRPMNYETPTHTVNRRVLILNYRIHAR